MRKEKIDLKGEVMGIGERLKELRESYGYSQKKLAGLVNVTDSAIANYEKNLNYPKIDVIIDLMNALKCDANYLYQDYIPKVNIWELSEEERMIITKYRKLNDHGKKATKCILDVEYERAEPWNQNMKKETIDVYSLILKKGGYAISQAPKTIHVPSTDITEKAAFGLKMVSNFEKPLFFIGDTILFEDKKPLHNQVGLFWLNGFLHIRKMYKKNGVTKLIPFNASADTIVVSQKDNFKVIGTYVGKLGYL